jgi:hypothetical protein
MKKEFCSPFQSCPIYAYLRTTPRCAFPLQQRPTSIRHYAFRIWHLTFLIDLRQNGINEANNLGLTAKISGNEQAENSQIFLGPSYNHPIIILRSLIIILQPSYDHHTIIILESSKVHLMLILGSSHDHHTII